MLSKRISLDNGIITTNTSVRDLTPIQVFHFRRIANNLVTKIIEDQPNGRLILLLDGISGAGKSTFSWFVCEALRNKGRSLIDYDGALSQDLWFVSVDKYNQNNAVIKDKLMRGINVSTESYLASWRMSEIQEFFTDLLLWQESELDKNKGKIFTISQANIESANREAKGRANISFLIRADADVVVDGSFIGMAAPILREKGGKIVRLFADTKVIRERYLTRSAKQFGLQMDSDSMQFRARRYDKLIVPNWEEYVSIFSEDYLVNTLSDDPSSWCFSCR